eukprot:152077_1
MASKAIFFSLIYHIFLIAATTAAESSFVIQINASKISSKTIWNPWTTENAADYTGQWINNANINKTIPINQQYPFLSRMKFAYSTGGCYKGYRDVNNKTCTTTFDLLQDPSNPNSSYNFSQLHTAVDNALKMGLKPYIVIGLIPIAYSINATLSNAKNLNELPPTYSYEKYGDYIYALAKYFNNYYDPNEIKNWLFGVITEFNNYGHFDDAYNINATETEYFKVYDYTECNLKKGFGNTNFVLGAHSCRNCRRGFPHSWDPDDLVKHIATEENYCTGVTGNTKMDFYSSSFYEHEPGNPGDQSMFDEYICSMHDVIEKYNLTDQIYIAIDEGRIIADQYGIQMRPRATGHTYQASWDSLLFVNMIRCNVSRFVRWGINSAGVGLNPGTQYVTPVDPVSANIIKLTYKMTGDNMLDMSINMTGEISQNDGNNNTQIVNGLSSISQDGKAVIRVFVFNHNSDLFSNQTANTSVFLCDTKKYQPNDAYCMVTEWLVDDNNSQFWNIYWNDVVENNITSFCGYPNRSNQGEELCFEDLKEREYIQSRNSVYQNASKLVSKSYQIEYKVNECMEITQQMIPSHGVRLFEVSC